MSISKINFKLMSLVHETFYNLLRDPYKVLKVAGLGSGQKVLEVGCGPGFFTIPAARIIGENGQVYALDLNPLAINRVKEKIEKESVTNVKTILTDVSRTTLPYQNFDLVFLFGFTRPIGQLEKIWVNLYQALKPEGILSVEGRLRPPNDLFSRIKKQRRISQYKKASPYETAKPRLVDI
jgi:ubiquinone/menaquinone biosynthesis C-methylase UbiE